MLLIDVRMAGLRRWATGEAVILGRKVEGLGARNPASATSLLPAAATGCATTAHIPCILFNVLHDDRSTRTDNCPRTTFTLNPYSRRSAELGNYGEYSGAPNTSETYQYARTVLDCATAHADGRGRALLIGGGIANFTDVAATFTGIIQALRERAAALQVG